MPTAPLRGTSKREAGNQNRPKPVGGGFGFFDPDNDFEMEPQSKDSVAVPLPATGSLSFNPIQINEDPVDTKEWITISPTEPLGLATQFISEAAETVGENVPDILSAVGDLLTEDVIGISKAKAENQNLTPEAEQKRGENLAYKQALAVIKKEEQRYHQQTKEKTVAEALRIIERPVTTQDVAILGLNYTEASKVATAYHLTQMKIMSTQQRKAAEAAQRAKQQAQITSSSSRRAGPNFDLNKVGEGGSILASVNGGVG